MITTSALKKIFKRILKKEDKFNQEKFSQMNRLEKKD
jgi:hypothetical protein